MKIANFMKSGVFFFLSILVFTGCESQNSYQPQTHIVEIRDMKFQPAELNVHKGDTVIWINKDIVAHDVTEQDKVWASPALASDSSWTKIIMQSDAYYCSIHVVMKGKLTVEE